MEFTNPSQPAGLPIMYDVFKQFTIEIPVIHKSASFLLVEYKCAYIATSLTDINDMISDIENTGLLGFPAFNPVDAVGYKKLTYVISENPGYTWHHIMQNNVKHDPWIGFLFAPQTYFQDRKLMPLINRCRKTNGGIWADFRIGRRPANMTYWYDLPDADKALFRAAVDICRASIISGVESGIYG